MQILEELRERGFVHQFTEGLPARPLAVYCGFDPTAPSLHAGSLVQLMLLGHLARAGYKIFCVVGGGTGMVGDPSGRDTTRDILTPERIQDNIDGITPQIRRFCPEATVLNNGEWLLGLNYIEFLRDVGKHFSVNRMLGADSVRMRLERDQGLSFIEFNYVLLQAYDFLALFRRHDCQLQVGGQDQWFNILMGTELIHRMEGKDSWGLTTPLLTTANGSKMGKTAAGAVWLDPERTSAFDYYQYWYNCDDRDIGKFLKLFTFLSLQEIEKILEGGPRQAKHRLALEATRIAHGEISALRTQEAVFGMFGRPGGQKVFSTTEATPAYATTFPCPLLDLLVGAGLCKSKGEARQKIREGAVKIGEARSDVSDDKLDVEGPTVLWVGKKHAVRLVEVSLSPHPT